MLKLYACLVALLLGVASSSAQLATTTAAAPERYDQGRLGEGLLPLGDVFEPLWADPFWPLMSASYHRYVQDDFLENVAAFTIGGTIPIYRWKDPAIPDLDWLEFALQTAVHSDFDQDRFSRDNFNNDFVFGGMLNARKGRWSGMFRLWHRSSHVGDEYLTNDSGVIREDFSYDRADLRLSYDVLGNAYIDDHGLLRVYGGFGRALRRPSPPSYEFWHLQWGVEARAPIELWDHWRPVASADVQQQEGNGFKLDFNLRAGLQAENQKVHGRNIKFLAEFYNGKEPNGQFWEDDVLYVGFGMFVTL
ncbi:MAG: DUF1207 domain-containing protein [Planctomycetota bacterium]